jgi:hypothetical protein
VNEDLPRLLAEANLSLRELARRVEVDPTFSVAKRFEASAVEVCERTSRRSHCWGP